MAVAQSYPDHPVKFILPMSAGGAGDTMFRPLVPYLSEVLGQPVVVENVPGATGTLGVQAALKEAPDGYSVLMMSSAHIVNETLQPERGFEITKDFEPLTKLANVPYVFVTHESLGVNSLEEFVAYAKERPGEIDYVSSGVGSAYHLAIELFTSAAGIELNHVPYSTSSAARADVVAGHIPVLFDNIPTLVPFIESGVLRAHAVTSVNRSALLPDVPSFSETYPGFEADGYNGFMILKGASPEVKAKLLDAILKALSQPEVKEIYKTLGLEITASDSPEEFGKFLDADITRWAKAIELAGIKQ
jgi:tripartite-type tricarboxylate transporter receptor subunit TctC